MKKITAVIMILALLFGVSSCAKKSVITLTYPLTYALKVLDPQVSTGSNADIVINNCFEGLTRFDKDYKISSGVAENWDISSDGLTYTFHLRKDARWLLLDSLHEDTVGYKTDNFDDRVTAKDFVFAFRRAVSQETQCPDYSKFFVIKNARDIYDGKKSADSLGVSAPDEYTFVITLQSTCPDMLERLSTPAFMPCNEQFFEMTGGRYGLKPEYIITNGPFYIKLWDDNGITVKRSAVYSGENEASPSTVNFVYNSDEKDIASKISSGSYCAGIFSSKTNAPQENAVVGEIDNTVYALCFNTADSNMSNKNLRLSLCSCIDRSALELPEDMSGFSNSVVPKVCTAGDVFYHANVNSQVKPTAYNLNSAAAYWQKALTELDKKSLKIEILCEEKYENVLGSFMQQLQKTMGTSLIIGITSLDETELQKRLVTKDYQLAFAPVRCYADTVPEFLSEFLPDKKDGSFTVNDKFYAELIEKINTAPGKQELLNACFTADSWLVENAIFCPLFTCPGCVAVSSEFSNIDFYPSGNNISFIRVTDN